MHTANCATDNPTAHSTEIPVMPLGWIPVARLISSGRLRPPRTTNASPGIFSTLGFFDSNTRYTLPEIDKKFMFLAQCPILDAQYHDLRLLGIL